MEDSDLQVADGDPAGDADLVGDEDLVKDVKQAVNVSARVHVGHFDLAFVVCESTTWFYSLAFFLFSHAANIRSRNDGFSSSEYCAFYNMYQYLV